MVDKKTPEQLKIELLELEIKRLKQENLIYKNITNNLNKLDVAKLKIDNDILRKQLKNAGLTPITEEDKKGEDTNPKKPDNSKPKEEQEKPKKEKKIEEDPNIKRDKKDDENNTPPTAKKTLTLTSPQLEKKRKQKIFKNIFEKDKKIKDNIIKWRKITTDEETFLTEAKKKENDSTIEPIILIRQSEDKNLWGFIYCSKSTFAYFSSNEKEWKKERDDIETWLKNKGVKREFDKEDGRLKGNEKNEEDFSVCWCLAYFDAWANSGNNWDDEILNEQSNWKKTLKDYKDVFNKSRTEFEEKILTKLLTNSQVLKKWTNTSGDAEKDRKTKGFPFIENSRFLHYLTTNINYRFIILADFSWTDKTWGFLVYDKLHGISYLTGDFANHSIKLERAKKWIKENNIKFGEKILNEDIGKFKLNFNNGIVNETNTAIWCLSALEILANNLDNNKGASWSDVQVLDRWLENPQDYEYKYQQALIEVTK